MIDFFKKRSEILQKLKQEKKNSTLQSATFGLIQSQ